MRRLSIVLSCVLPCAFVTLPLLAAQEEYFNCKQRCGLTASTDTYVYSNAQSEWDAKDILDTKCSSRNMTLQTQPECQAVYKTFSDESYQRCVTGVEPLGCYASFVCVGTTGSGQVSEAQVDSWRPLYTESGQREGVYGSFSDVEASVKTSFPYLAEHYHWVDYRCYLLHH